MEKICILVILVAICTCSVLGQPPLNDRCRTVQMNEDTDNYYKNSYDYVPFKDSVHDPLTIWYVEGRYCVCNVRQKSTCFPGKATFDEGAIAYFGESEGNGCRVICGMSNNEGEVCVTECEYLDWIDDDVYFRGTYHPTTYWGISNWGDATCRRIKRDSCCSGSASYCIGLGPPKCVPDENCEIPNIPSGCMTCRCVALYEYHEPSYPWEEWIPYCTGETVMECKMHGVPKTHRLYSYLSRTDLLHAFYLMCGALDFDPNFPYYNCGNDHYWITDENCCPIYCTTVAPCDCEGLSANSTDGWKLDIQSDSKQDPHRALGVIPGIKVGGRKRLFIKRDDDSSFCLHSLYMKILCVKEVYIKINLDNGEVVKDTVEIDFPQEYEANLGPFDYNNVHSVRLGFKKWVDNCPSAHTYSLQLNTCDPSGN